MTLLREGIGLALILAVGLWGFLGLVVFLISLGMGTS